MSRPVRARLAQRSITGRWIAAALCLAATSVRASSPPPSISSFPVVNASTLIADDATQYTVTTTASDNNGYNDIRCIRVLFNYTESGGDETQGRGYMDWGKTDADVIQYGGTWIIADATGGGRWAYRTDAWGGITYISPLACSTTTSGLASGGIGYRTVTWTFTVKPAWAFNPVMNDADAWVADGTIDGTSYAIGWFDGLTPFDVVAATCTTVCATPHPPVLSNPTDTTVSVAINLNDSSLNLYAIAIAPSLGGKMYVQSDGSLGTAPRWYDPSTWGVITVSGLLPNTNYSFSARASRSLAGYCPSGWSLAAQISTTGTLPVIDYRQGTPFSPGVRGQSLHRQITETGYAPTWGLSTGAFGRGPAGGLDADCYDWRDIYSGMNWGLGGGYFTTLEFLQHARNHNAPPLITANAFGGGYRDPIDGTFHCQFLNPDGLAADWVRYTNFILQNYRQGDEASLTGDDLRIYNAITNWDTKAKLLDSNEPPTPTVDYWEIGNEPELGGILIDHYLSPVAYRDRYKLIGAAMKAVDPTINIGPCLMTPTDPDSGSGRWLDALAADSSAQIDFVGYHPYYSQIKIAWGYAEGMATALRGCKSFLNSISAGIRSIMSQHARTDYELIASEWNAVSHDSASPLQKSMANAIGAVETCFTFAEDGVLGANFFWFWEVPQPQAKLGPYGAFTGLASYMGDVLITTGEQMGYNPINANFRIYVTRFADDPDTIMIWGLNFDDSLPATVNLSLAPCQVLSATLMHFGIPGDDNAGGDTSLTMYTGMAWDQQDVTAGFDSANFPFTMEDAEITLLVLNIARYPLIDHDHDGDVDQEDFGWFQSCITGPNQTQDNPDCLYARLDTGTDVDQQDMALFLSCMTAPGVPANPDCPN